MDTLQLIERARNGDKEAREQVITENIPLVWSIVRRSGIDNSFNLLIRKLNKILELHI